MTENNENIIKLVESGFKDVSESIVEIHEGFAEMIKRIEEIEKKLNKKETKKKESKESSDFGFEEKFNTLYTTYLDYDFMLTPLAEMTHFTITVDTMLEGTSPKTDVEIVTYIMETYGKRCIHYIRAALTALKSSPRITLTRALKRIEKMISSNRIKGENADCIEDEDEEEIDNEDDT